MFAVQIMASREGRKPKAERVKLAKMSDPDYVVKQLVSLNFC